MENKLPTAEDMLRNSDVILGDFSTENDMCNLMRSFAEIHVKAALNAASSIGDQWENSGELAPYIMEAYPLTNIQ